jgi:hypothetical protein
MTNDNLANEILTKINDEHITPKPKWEFMLRSYFGWFLVFVSLLIGALAVSVVIFMFDNNQWDLYDHISGNMLAFILATLPYFWLIILMAFIYLIYLNFKNTQHGYKYSAFLVILAGVLISIIFGFIFYNLGLGQTIDDIFAQRAPLYNQIINRRPKLFYHPNEGILPGKIIEIINPEQFTLDDFNRQEWLVAKDMRILDLPLHEGQAVILIGEQTDEFEFHANDVRVLKPQMYLRLRLPAFFQN